MTSKEGVLRRSCDIRLLPLPLKRYLVIYGIIIIVATGVMTLRLRAPNFGLLDDGVTIAVASAILQEFKAGHWGVILRLEAERGRFRPLYWLYYAIPYYISGPSAFGFFMAQWLSLVLTGVVIFSAVKVATKDALAGVLSSLFYILSPPVIENYYTLSKPEPPVVLWLALSLYFLWRSSETLISDRNRRNVLLIASSLFLSIAYFTKETVLAVLLISVLWTVSRLFQISKFRDRRFFETTYKYFIINIIIACFYWGARILSGTLDISSGGDSSHYKFMFETLSDSLLRHVSWYIRDFLYLMPILIFLTCLTFIRKRNVLSLRSLLIFESLLWISGWTAIMLPWHSILEYYLLPATLGVSVIAGIGMSEIVKHLWNISNIVRKFSFVSFFCVLFTSSIGTTNGLTSGRIQVAVDSANIELIEYLALNMPSNSTLLVNLPEPNEYIFEMGLHLAVFKQRPDIHVRYFDRLNLPIDVDAFIVTPIMQNQPHPSVRIAVQEDDAKILKSNLYNILGNRVTLVYEKVETVRLFTVAVETVICPWLIHTHGRDVAHCGGNRSVIDRRIFRYGWEVYRI